MKVVARAAAALLMLLVLALALPAPSHAQDQAEQGTTKIDQRKLLVPPRNEDGSLKTPSIWREPVAWVMDKQRSFYGAMSQSIRQVKSQSSFAAAWTLMLLSFGYGVFHAAGPGHGKAVISAWLIATENELRRGIIVAFMSALVQALSAIAIVSVLLLLVTAVGSTARDVAGFLESASYALVALMGAYLVWTAFRPHGHVHEHGHIHDHADGHAHHDHAVHDAVCGHGHAPEARQVKGEWSWLKASSLAFAVGIRPCTGAILVLVSANLLGLYWAGVTSTFVMAFGTAVTVSVIAAFAVYARKLALSLAKRDSEWLSFLGTGLRLGGGLVIAVLGGLLFWGSLITTSGMM